MSGILTIAHLTLHEARRRRIVLAAAVFGIGFLAVFGTGMYFITRDLDNPIERGATVTILAILGIYGVNFLATAAAILLSVDTLSGEIGSGVIQTLASKPVRRADVVLGKWLGYWGLTIAYLLAMTAGLVLILRVITGYMQPGLEYALPLMALEVTVLLTFTIAGGTRFSTVTNGIVAFGFYGLAFAGGIVEQAGTILGNLVARDLGTAVSLISPADALWRMAAYYLVPDFVRNLQEGPPMMWSVSAPTAAMVVWSIAFVPVVMAMAVRAFNRRTL
jgi:ABC-type transport system involved in multi-copper enzyme maturation permease subunit